MELVPLLLLFLKNASSSTLYNTIMAVRKAIRLKGGGTLLIHTNGKRTYIPTRAYEEMRKEFTRTRVFRGKPDTRENCFRLLNAIHKLLVAAQRSKGLEASVNTQDQSVSSYSL